MNANLSSMETAAKRPVDRSPGSSFDALCKSGVRVLRHLLRNPMTLAGLLVALLLVVVAAFAPWIATHDPVAQNLANALQAPGSAHWFGTDEYGRDIFSRLVYGSRITLYIIGLVTVIVGPIGLFIGTVSGYFGGAVDTVFMRLTDIFISFPSLVLALAFIAALGPGLEHAVVAIALTSWPPIARLARAETLSLRNADFVVAVELQGASPARIILRHIVPMCLSSVIIRLTMNMAGIILTAAALGFLGLGAQAPLPEWGAMISTGRRYMLECWWLVAVPGAAIMLVSLAFNLLGDGLRDILDPRSE
ncbi:MULTISPECIES: ABC transporter permease [Pseudomonas]|jgi:peptide/nickel transport system permease protein|uniref:ABC transporter permease n=1 Tax=Pseudomonas TaxID=286 RepID=UPI0008126A8C|nr:MULTISPECIES: ABC transporter permease [Pseudomonas]MCX9151690.1 ABC transporter permease [Pseudomonas sp. TB1-B1]CRM33784.1 putative D,D-dipeptide transport system permease protein DdpC [Pseudomonas sp. 31 E 5]CRM80279.1 putative D,D-dipeptide transport system permease protein DdpC [Pseudomonas sp. 31 E 6]CRM88015.1 putative D,D-dipeptide transport system permease protein DdpC [Pseudomonas sp. 22 E 5]